MRHHLLRFFHSSCRTNLAAKSRRIPRPLVFKGYLGKDAKKSDTMSGTAMESVGGSDNKTPKIIGEVRTLSDVERDLPSSKRPRRDGEVDRDRTSRKGKAKKKIKKKDRVLPEKYSAEDVLWQDIVSVLGGKSIVDDALEEESEFDSPYDTGDVLEVEIVSLSSTGEAIGIVNGKKRAPKPWVIVTRFCLPKETVRVRVYWNKRLHSVADMIEVVTPNLELRDNSRIKCKYFAKCGGCQYQMLSYDHQLKLKRDVIIKAYKAFSKLPDSSVPIIQSTIPSPLQYGYRTKLTPHFDAPPKEHRKKKADVVDGKVVKPEWLKIGFNKAGTHRVMDIEECPIATPILNNALPSIRENIYRNVHRYEKGVSLTLRDSLIIPNPSSSTSSTSSEAIPPPSSPSSATSPDIQDSTDDALSTLLSKHVCISDPKSTVREKVGDFIFEYTASSFFQNNNSVLFPLTEYVRDAIFPPPSTSTTTAFSSSQASPTHLVDAYCGAGLFSITLSPYFEKIAGIELSTESIKAAQHNASLNAIPSSKITFRAGDAGDLFASVRQDFPPAQTVLVIDPPRKGCDDNFIQQVLDFRCGTIVYVSCNVHTQARDVGKLVDRTKEDGVGRRYVIESLRGFDLFPQTAHIESVAVLRLA